jgi:hypothetical protein
MPIKPQSRPRSNQRAGRKKHTRTRARAKQVTSSPRMRVAGTRTSARKLTTATRSRAKATTKAQPKMAQIQSSTTTDLDEIRQWAEARGGTPASVRGTGDESEEAGILRIDFPGGAGRDKLEPISWEEWYQKFRDKGLAFLYQARTKGGKTSRFFKLVKL